MMPFLGEADVCTLCSMVPKIAAEDHPSPCNELASTRLPITYGEYVFLGLFMTQGREEPMGSRKAGCSCWGTLSQGYCTT
eukprot:scaffold429_cov269-Pinguiococcus_pyrenoidosus.AAC.9